MAEYAVTLRETMKYSQVSESRRPRIVQNPFATTPLKQTKVFGDLPAMRKEQVLHQLYNDASLDPTTCTTRVLVRTENPPGTDISKFIYSPEARHTG